MTILFFSRLFYPHIGGVEKHVYEISKRLIEKGNNVVVITEKYDHQLKNKEIHKGIQIYRIPTTRQEFFKKFIIWRWLFKNIRLIKQVDLIHCHDVFYWYFPFRFLFFKKPIFTTFHGYEKYPISQRAVLVRKLSEYLSWGTICIGEFMKKWYQAKPKIISYGAVEITNKKGSTISSNSAVFIGRLDEQTNILEYLKAVEIIRKKDPDFNFVIVGDGEFKKMIGRNFKVLGFKKKASEYFYEYHFAFVSRYLSILEAMAAKKLIFAFYDNSLKEDYLRMTPFSKYINIINSAEELAVRVQYFINNPDKEKIFTEKAYEWVKNQTWNNLLELYLDLWKKN